MKSVLSTALGVSMLATSAFADTPLADIRTYASQIEKGSEHITRLLKEKQPDVRGVRDGIAAMAVDIENLQRLVAEVTEANPSFVARSDKDWDLLKTQVQLLGVFHSHKDELMKADDMKKNRSTLRAQAKGLTTRAEMLQATAQRLQR